MSKYYCYNTSYSRSELEESEAYLLGGVSNDSRYIIIYANIGSYFFNKELIDGSEIEIRNSKELSKLLTKINRDKKIDNILDE